MTVVLAPGFADPATQAQRCFRLLLDAFASPGTVHRVDAGVTPPPPLMPASAALLLTLADADTPVWTDAGPAADAWLRFHTGCPAADLGTATFALATGTPPPLAALAPGTEEAPHRSATLILHCAALTAGHGWRLTGPGIAAAHHLHAPGLPPGFLAERRADLARYPLGVDVILCAGDRLAALPRTTAIEAPR